MTTEEKAEKVKLDFNIIREEWSKYKLVDEGSIAKIKMSITNLVDTGRKKGKMHEIEFGTKHLFYKEPSPDDKGDPSEDIKISEKDIIQDLKFEKISEPINIYDVPEKLVLLVKASLTKIQKTKKFDANGNRIYSYVLNCAITVVPYPE